MPRPRKGGRQAPGPICRTVTCQERQSSGSSWSRDGLVIRTVLLAGDMNSRRWKRPAPERPGKASWGLRAGGSWQGEVDSQDPHVRLLELN